MNFNWNFNKEKNLLTIELEGKISSTNAQEVEEALMSIYNQNTGAGLELDASKLTYVSSAGLRVILKMFKMQKNFKITNVCRDVYEIFEMTGFSELMPIQKALREINVDDCQVIGTGGHCKVLRLNGDTIIKLLHPGTPLEDAEREREYAKKAFVMGLPTAIPFDVVKCGDSIGLVFEMVNSDTFSAFLNKNPHRFEEFAVKYAKLMKQLHATKVTDDVLASTKQLYRDRINRLQTLGYFNDQEIADLHRINDAFSDEKSIIHGDYHPKNVMVMDDELVLIDMADITYGNPLYDLGSMMLTHVTVTGERKESITGLKSEMVDNLWKIFISVYLETTDAQKIELTMKKAGIFAMLKAATALAFSPSANQDYIVQYVTNMARTKLLCNTDGCVALIKM